MNEQRILLAGAAGAIGSALVPLLQQAGYQVHGTTRRADRAAELERAGVVPVMVDVYDASALAAALMRTAPVVVVHQLTDLPLDLDPKLMPAAQIANARLRDEGTRNLVAAAMAAGCTRMVAQSVAWAYLPGPRPLVEDSPLDEKGMRGVVALEHAVLRTPGLSGTVLRYGRLYGPRTSTMVAPNTIPLHVEAAAWGALLAVQRHKAGAFNMAEDSELLSSAKARRELGWSPSLRLPQQVVA